MLEANVIFHVFMCVTQSLFMPILNLTLNILCYLLSCNHMLNVNFFFFRQNNKFEVNHVTLLTCVMSIPRQALFFFSSQENDSLSRFLLHYLQRSR